MAYRIPVAVAVLWWLAATSAYACTIYTAPNLTDARRADTVVVGHVMNDVREVSPARKAWLESWRAKNPHASRAERITVERSAGRARLTFIVDRAIVGSPPRKITVLWDTQINNGPPDRISGGYVFALFKEPQGSPSADGGRYAVMQGPCSGAFAFPRGTPEANAIRAMFGLSPELLEAPRSTVADMIRSPSIPWPSLIAYGILAIGAALILLILVWPRRKPS